MSDAADTDTDTSSMLLGVITKALSEGAGAEFSQQLQQEDEAFRNADALPCPYPPELLIRLFEKSSALRPCVDAMVTNVNGFGHRWVPTIDLKSSDADKMLAASILAERLQDGDEDPAEPTPEEIAERRQQIERGIQIEELRMKFFLAACSKEGFAKLRKRVWTDFEITGNAYIEVLRNAATGKITQLVYVPATTMRLRARDQTFVPVVWRVKEAGAVRYAEVERQERFRPFVQRVLGYQAFFREFGDPRPMDKNTGVSYPVGAKLPRSFKAATEIIHLSEESSRSSYGIPRWIGATIEVLGLRAASEVNYDIFDNKGVPPYMFLVSGGKLTTGAEQQIAAHINARLKGRQNYHVPLILEAMPPNGGADPAAAGRIRIQAVPMAQPQDGTHLLYSDKCENVIAQQWRLSPISRGRTDGSYNFATAKAAMKKDEEQVFAPARAGFDELFNRTIVTDLGIRYIRLESNSPTATDSEVMTTIIDVLAKNGTITPEEARQIASSVLNKELPQIDAAWTKQPLALTLAGIPLEQMATGAATPDPGIALMQRLVGLRDQLKADQTKAFGDAQVKSLLLAANGGDPEVMQVPADLLAKWVDVQAAA